LRQSGPKRHQGNTGWLRQNSFFANLVPSWGVFGGGLSVVGRAGIDAVSIWQDVMTHFEQLEKHLFDDVLIFANLIQIPAVILTGAAAWLVCRPIRRWTMSWVERVSEHYHLDWVASHRSWVTDRLVPLITPMA
jgi:hypothetical protein